MRVTEIMLSSCFGGMERLFLDSVLELAGRGHEVQAICRASFVRRQTLQGLDRVTLQPLRLMGTWDPLAGCRLAAEIRAFRPDVVHTHGRRAAWMGGKAARRANVACMATLHNEGSLHRYRYVDTLIATSEELFQFAVKQGWPAKRIAMIPCFSRIPAIASLQPPKAGPLRFLSLGRFVPEKGFDLLLSAFRTVLDQRVDAVLLLGGEGAERTRLEGICRQLRLGDQVRFVGWINDVAAALDEADVFVLPSRAESFGIVILEAMARGVSIVSTLTPGPRQVLDEQTAYLAEVNSADSLASAMLLAAREDNRRRILAQAALSRYRQRYSADAVLPSLLKRLAMQANPPLVAEAV